MPKRYKLRGASLEAIRAKALQQYGPGARVVAAEKVTNPGIVGLFAAARFEATVEVGDAPTGGPTVVPSSADHPAVHDLHGPAIAALLERADAAELEMHKPDPVSTASPDFAGLLEQLGKELEAVPAAPSTLVPLPGAEGPAGPASAAVASAAVASAAVVTVPPSDVVPLQVPTPLTGDGNLIILLGLGDDALGPALEMSIAAGGSDVRTAGGLNAFGHLHVKGRQSATAARAQAVLTGQGVVVAFGLGGPRDAVSHAALIGSLSADQLWLVVDARRKAEDTKAWVSALQSMLENDSARVYGLAVIGASETATPETVDGLGIPVGWVDGKPASTPVLGKVH
ncbi:hypothetical protein AAHB33_04575 [Paenarthrobacter sp. S56]|uniref:hypothetical protein n=1 Tax=Paenarthrobacter sp. S56 TaxID=3138179 RepID=UPI003219E955